MRSFFFCIESENLENKPFFEMGDALGRVPISSKICLLAGRKKKLGDGDEICISMEKTEKVYT